LPGEQRAALAPPDWRLHDFPNTYGLVLKWGFGDVRFENAFAASVVIFAAVPTALLASGVRWAGRRMARYVLLAGRGGLRRAAVRPLGLPREDQGRPVGRVGVTRRREGPSRKKGAVKDLGKAD
jgi:hypothetical protein